MRDFWYNASYLTVAALAGFFVWSLFDLMRIAAEQEQVRYEQCIAADKQWIEGSCVK
jgi:hypothetical protein